MRRKGELTIAQILREWPHQVALPADQVREGFASIDAAARALQRAPWGPRLRRDDRDYVVYCFRSAGDADQFNGEVLPKPGH